MNYSVSNLNEVVDCIELLSWATREKEDLDHRRRNELRLVTKYGETSIEVDAVLQGVVVEISATELIIAGLPEGHAKQDAIVKLTKLVYKKFLLETRREDYGTLALLGKEMDLARILKEMEEVDVFMSSIEDRKTFLESQA